MDIHFYRLAILKKITPLAALVFLAACNLPRPEPTAVPSPILPFPSLINSPAPAETEQPLLSGKIVYTCQPSKLSGFNHICMMNPDGGEQVQLTTDDTADHFFASFAPDGESIVFSSNQTGDYEIYEMDLAGIQTRLTDSISAFAPAISPDGNEIVYSFSPGPEMTDSQLWRMGRDGSDRFPLTNLDGGAWDAVWSPDGGRILFASMLGENVQLFTINANGSDLRQVTTNEGLRGRSDWSPLGNLMSTYIGTLWSREIAVFAPDGSNLTFITDGGNNLAPSFSPDGEWIVFTSYLDHFQKADGCEIYIIRIDGSDRRRLTDNDFCDWQPRWGK